MSVWSRWRLRTAVMTASVAIFIYISTFLPGLVKQMKTARLPSYLLNTPNTSHFPVLNSSVSKYLQTSNIRRSGSYDDVWEDSWSEKQLDPILNHELEHLAPFVPVSVGFGKTKNFAEVKQWQQYYGNNSQKFITDILSSGFGLEAYKTERGEDAWIENGVVFRPYRAPKVTPKYPSPYKPEVEPYVPFDPKTFFESRPNANISQNEKKIILRHTKTRYWPVMNNLEPLRSCPELPCVVTTNRNYTTASSAMVFAAQLITGNPPERRPDQIFIFHNHEPETPDWVMKSVVANNKFEWKKAFNWTMTYRFDSDISFPYGIIRRRKVPKKRDYQSIVANKTKMVAWMVSHCGTHGQREKYVKELSKHIPVDIYGTCGTFKCPRSSDSNCFQMIERTYKFYLSLENAMCKDYITEKFFRYFQSTMIQVVRGDNKYFRHAPPETFLNTADFHSPKELAARMWELARNEKELIRMIQEKDKYIAIYDAHPIRNAPGDIRFMAYHNEAVSFCEICQKLWNIDKYGKTVPDVWKWFIKGECYAPKDL